MKLFNYNQFIKESKSDIVLICRRWGIYNYTINEDESIDVNGNIDLSSEKLTKLPLKFRRVSGDFHCESNQLISLEGCPQSIDGDFNCYSNGLTSLEGCPQIIGGDFHCYYNQLTSLEGCPQSVGGYFNCNSNRITSLKGFPEYFGGEFCFAANPVNEILKLFNDHQKSIDWINEYDVIQGNKIIFQRLEAVAYELKIELPEKIKLKNYEII